MNLSDIFDIIISPLGVSWSYMGLKAILNLKKFAQQLKVLEIELKRLKEVVDNNGENEKDNKK